MLPNILQSRHFITPKTPKSSISFTYHNPFFHPIATISPRMLLQSIVQHGYNHSSDKLSHRPKQLSQNSTGTTELPRILLSIYKAAELCLLMPHIPVGCPQKIYFQIPRLRHSLLYSKAKSTTMPHHHRYTQDITVRQWARDGVIWRQHFFIWL